ncbi:MAG: sulfatase [Armatimonadetes bacterium]|nr:sulfatase [Armatimonadota bacterium]
MNVIFVMCDTFRWDYLGCYGSDWVKTPCLDRFAEQAFLFERAYCASVPTVPNRRDILTGLNCYTHGTWEPLPKSEVTLPEVLGASGIVSQMFVDTPHLMQNGFNFARGFSGYEWIRGQENDHWQSFPAEVTFPCDPAKMRNPDYIVAQYLRNTHWWQHEEDTFVARTMAGAEKWLEKNYDRDFFLYIDTFDPHEPFDPPQHYLDMYDPGYSGEKVIYPHYAPCDCYLSPEEQQHIRALYAGECTLVDRWIGKLLDKVDDLGLRENTAIVFTTDHGFVLGEHGMMGKSIILDSYFEECHLYQEIAHIPLIIRLPEQEAGMRVPALTSTSDMFPTLLEMFGVVESGTDVSGESTVQLLQCGFHQNVGWNLALDMLHGKSLMPLMRFEEESLRDVVVTGFSLIDASPRLAKATITSEDGWSMSYAGASKDPANELPVPADNPFPSGTNAGDYQLGDTATRLWNLNDDPKQLTDVSDGNKDVARELHAKYVEYLRKCNTPEEHLAYREKLDV